MKQNDGVVCANYYCPLSEICGRFNTIPDGEVHRYAVYPFNTDAETFEVTCDYFIPNDEINIRTEPRPNW